MTGTMIESKDLKQLFEGVPEEDLGLIKNALKRFLSKVYEEGK